MVDSMGAYQLVGGSEPDLGFKRFLGWHLQAEWGLVAGWGVLVHGHGSVADGVSICGSASSWASGMGLVLSLE
eukprot:gene6313-biopygen13613